MSINIPSRTDTSFLFGNSSNNNSFNSMSWMKDYGLIKSGAYSKLMKSYYSQDSVKESSKSEASKSAAKEALNTADKTKNTVSESYNKVSSAAKSVQDSVKKLQDTKEEDSEALVSAVKDYVKGYNSLVYSSASDDVKKDKTISGRMNSLNEISNSNKDKLESIGVTVGRDGKLSLDEDKLKKASSSDIKDVFNGNSSYGYRASVSAGMVQSNANFAATRNSIYNASAQALGGTSNGNLYDFFT